MRTLTLEFNNRRPTKDGVYLIVLVIEDPDDPDSIALTYMLAPWENGRWALEDSVVHDMETDQLITPDNFREWAYLDESVLQANGEEIVAIDKERRRLEGLL